MANKSISMIEIKQVLRFDSNGESNLSIYRLTGVSSNTLKKYIKDYKSFNLHILEIEGSSDQDLEDMFSQCKYAI